MVYVWMRLNTGYAFNRVGRKALLPGYQYQIITHKKPPEVCLGGLFVLAFIVGLRKACNPTYAATTLG